MYDGDSFYTLTGIGRIGLVALSVTATALLIWVLISSTRRMTWPIRVIVALLLFFAFVWLSPQLYYTYYMTLFDGLPWQIVVKDPPSANYLFKLLTFRGPANLSAHSLGTMGWVLIAAALITRRVGSAPPKDDPV